MNKRTGDAMSARGLRIAVAWLMFGVGSQSSAYDWLQFNGNAQHSGNNTAESVLNPGNINKLTLMFQTTLPATADGAPVFLESVSTSAGVKDLLLVTTTAGHIVALDARTGATVWMHQHGPGACTINNGGNTCYTTSSPAIDPNRMYVYSYGLDGYAHKLQVGDGSEIVTGGWPQLTTTKGFDEKGSSALSFATAAGVTYLYVAHAGYPGDNGDYQGHITAINLATGAQNVFNTLCSDQAVHFVHSPGTPDCPSVQTAIWARPGVIYDSGTDRIFMGTGNGFFDNALNYWGDSVFALNPDGTGSGGRPLDSYTPTNQDSLRASDTDLGSTAPAILPAPANSNVRHLAVQGGKDAKLRLINLANLSGLNGPGNLGGEIGNIIDVPQGGEVLSQPAAWVNPSDGTTWVFVVNGNGASGLRLAVDASGNPSLAAQWQNGRGGASPLMANNVLYYAAGGILRAADPLSGAVLWSSSIGSIHWQSPIVANGVVYIADGANHLTAFSVPGSLPPKALVYKPLPPCRLFDSRYASAASGVQGPIAGGTLKHVPGVVAAGANWGSYGGNPASDCGLANPPGTFVHGLAVVITILNPNSDAFLGVSDRNDLNATLSTVALNYAHGQGLSTMYVVPQIASSNIYFAMPAGLSAHLIFDAVGYFVSPDATALECTTQSSAPATIGASTNGSATSPTCGPGYALTSGSCDSDSSNMTLLTDKASGQAWLCSANNAGGSPAHLTATATCCRVPGR